MAKAWLSSLSKALNDLMFEYETQKIVTVRSHHIGFIYRFLQVLIIAYIVGYAIIYTKGYQDFDYGQSTIMTKIKGSASSLERKELPIDLQRIWDSADYVVPPMLRDTVFITTNVVITPKQSISTCAESPASNAATCLPETKNSTCEPGTIVRNGNGPMTGECVRNNQTAENYTCEVKAWCPLEDDSIVTRMTKPVLDEAENFTILLKNVVLFPNFKVTRRNIDSITNATDAKLCNYHPTKHPLCPIFRVGDIINLSGANLTEITLEGGAISVLIQWDCNFDFKLDYCNPTFDFSYLRGRKDLSGFSPGFNFRYGYYYRTSEDGPIMRDLIKAYGILIVFNVEAKAGKFSFVNLGLNVGAGLALLGLASFLMDWMLLNVSQYKTYYYQQKFVTISEDDLQKIRVKKRNTNESGLSTVASGEGDKSNETVALNSNEAIQTTA